MADTFDCSIPALVTAGREFHLRYLDAIDAESVRVYILALVLKSMGGTDYTDICALAESMRQYDGLPQSDLQTANLMALINLAESLGIQEPSTEAEVLALLKCGHCCTLTPTCMKTAETYLWCLIANAMPRQ